MPSAAAATTSQRLMSLDALRGFDMFWIIGADSLVHALDHMAGKGGNAESGSSFITQISDQLHHADWAGFRFYDLIFPLFVFMAGISVVFSLGRTIRQEGRAAAVKRVVRRSILLFVVALFYSGGFTNRWPEIRLLGVLNRIAICYFFAGLIFCFCNLRAMISIAAGLLVGYWALMSFVPIRNIQLDTAVLQKLAVERHAPMEPKALFYGTTERVTGKFDPGLNLSNEIDFMYLPGRMWDKYYDPEGILSTLPAIVTCLLGVFTGLLLINRSLNDQQKVIYLLAGGMVLAALGWGWSFNFPVVKKIWTSSFVLVAGGYSAVLLGVFYWIVDIAKWRWWCQPFVWMGMNSITIYVGKNLLGGFTNISKRVAGGDIYNFFDTRLHQSGELVLSIIGLLFAFWIVRYLYERKIFVRL
jgi:predicted acyltransferase